MSKVLVAVVSRTDLPFTPEDVCSMCKHYVRIDGEAQTVAARGGVVLCAMCARDVEQRRPGTFSDATLAKLPTSEDTEYPRSVVV